jgi:hypothetical protein
MKRTPDFPASALSISSLGELPIVLTQPAPVIQTGS